MGVVRGWSGLAGDGRGWPGVAGGGRGWPGIIGKARGGVAEDENLKV